MKFSRSYLWLLLIFPLVIGLARLRLDVEILNLLPKKLTVAGFCALAFSSNAGMASLGLVCALGITLALLAAVYLLPVWWKTLHAA